MGELFSHSDDDKEDDVFWDVRYSLLEHQHCKRMFGLCHQGYMEAAGSTV